MDWFERLTGFREADYASTLRRLSIAAGCLVSDASTARFGVGRFEMVSLRELRQRGSALPDAEVVRLSNVVGDVRALHRERELAGALFQVASQFNMLEMADPELTPEDGVTRYARDRTQGPACALAAGAATIFRNYLVPVGDSVGQTAHRQLDGLAEIGAALSQALGRPVTELWRMQNGYALCTEAGATRIGEHLNRAEETARDALRAELRIGVQWDAEVTEVEAAPRPTVTQAFCSAMPVGYSEVSPATWAPFAQLILEAAYEATLLVGRLNAARGASNVVLLTRLGGGVFENRAEWINTAIERALALHPRCGLDVRLVSYGRLDESNREVETRWREATSGS